MLRCATSVEEEFWLCVERLQLLYFHHFPFVDFKQHYRSALVTYQLLVAALPHRPSFIDHLSLLLAIHFSLILLGLFGILSVYFTLNKTLLRLSVMKESALLLL